MTLEERIYNFIEGARLISVEPVDRLTICDICRNRTARVLSCRVVVAHETLNQKFYLICADEDACNWRMAVRT